MDDSVKLIYKSTSSSTPPHEYFKFVNLSGDSLHIRWKLNHFHTYYPPEWQIALQDNEQYHNPVIDSNDIVIPDTATSTDKMIINIFHNMVPGEGQVVFDLYNLDSIQEMWRIKFVIEIYELVSIGENPNNNAADIRLFPNPVNEKLTIKGLGSQNCEIELFNTTGSRIPFDIPNFHSEIIELDLNSLESGHYLIRVAKNDGTYVVKPLIKTTD